MVGTWKLWPLSTSVSGKSGHCYVNHFGTKNTPCLTRGVLIHGSRLCSVILGSTWETAESTQILSKTALYSSVLFLPAHHYSWHTMIIISYFFISSKDRSSGSVKCCMTCCLSAELALPVWVHVYHAFLAIASVLSELESNSSLKEEQRTPLKHFLDGKETFTLLPIGFVRVW